MRLVRHGLCWALLITALLQEWPSGIGVLWAFDALRFPPQRTTAPALEEMPLPVGFHVSSLLLALDYELDHKNELKEGVRVTVVYAPGDPSSVHTEIMQQLEAYSAKPKVNRRVTFSETPYTTADQLRNFLQSNQINVVYVCPGNARNLAGILQANRERRAITVTGVPDYVREGVALGLLAARVRDSIYPRYSVNRLSSAKFDAYFLENALERFP